VALLAGSDNGAFNSYIYPGSSLHEELVAMVKAGLSPLEALRTSIANGPRFLRVQDQYGSISLGKNADLLLLEHNPLKNITHTKEIYKVIKGGLVFK
jgi:imidazolonepropionase-like amidohydrolase